MKHSSRSIERLCAFGWNDNGTSHRRCQAFDFRNLFARVNSVFEFRDSFIVAVDAVEGNAFLHFLNRASGFHALRDSFQRNADLVVVVDQFVFQHDVFTAEFGFEFFRSLVGGPFGFFPGVVFGFGFVFSFEFSFEWFRFGFVLVVFSVVFVEFGFVFGFIVHHCALVFAAGVLVRPQMTLVGACVEFTIEFVVFRIFGIFVILAEEFRVGEVASTEFGVFLTAKTAHHFARNLR